MFRTKADVERHVQNVLSKVKNEQERNLRCYNLAQLYYKVQDYDSTKKYVTMYLSVKSDSSVAYKLLGQACEGLNQKQNALNAYNKSLQLESNQKDLIFRICDLLCEGDVDFDDGMAKYWVERASLLFPHDSLVFKLKEKLLNESLKSSSNDVSSDMENLLQGELKARPNDVNVRIKLLKLHVETGRTESAYNHTVDVESKQMHSNSLIWYQCINHVCKVYSNQYSSKCDWAFFMHWICAHNKICSLTLTEISKEVHGITECFNAITEFDQTLFKANERSLKSPEIYNEFFKHMSAQLAFYLALYLLKKAKKEPGIIQEVKKSLGPLFALASVHPPSCDPVWCLSLKENQRKLLLNWGHEGLTRLVQSSHILSSMSKDTQSEKNFIEIINRHASDDWRKRLFKSHLGGESGMNTSYFVSSNKFVRIPQKILFADSTNITPAICGPSFEMHYPGSLHHLVWFGLKSVENPGSALNCKLSSTFNLISFKTLQPTVQNYKNDGVETLNQLDIESFLYLTIFCTSAVLDQMSNFHNALKPSLLPADISSCLCTSEQSKWWSLACEIKSGFQNKGNKMSEIRFTLQKGIQAVRGEVSLPLLIILARTMADKCSDPDKIEMSMNELYDDRAYQLWLKACNMLEEYSKKEVMDLKFKNDVKLFEYPETHLSASDVKKLLSEGRYFIGNYYLQKRKPEEAIEILKPIKTVEAIYTVAKAHKVIAENESCGLLPDEMSLEARNRNISLLNKAKDYCYSATDIIKNENNHPYHFKISVLLGDIDDMLSKLDFEDDIDDLANFSIISSSSRMNGDFMKNPSPIKFPNLSRNITSSTPSRRNESKHQTNCADLVEIVSLQQSNNQLKLQQVLEQTRLVLDRVENVVLEQKSQRNMIEEITNKFANLETEVKSTLSDIKKEVKKSDLYNVLDDEEYTDEMLQYNNYPPYPSYPQQRPQVPQLSGTNSGYPTRAPEYQSNMGLLPFMDKQQQNWSEFLLRNGQSLPNQILNQAIQNPTLNSSLTGFSTPLAAALPQLQHQALNPTLQSSLNQAASLQSSLNQAASLQSSLNQAATLQSSLNQAASLQSSLNQAASLQSSLNQAASLQSSLNQAASLQSSFNQASLQNTFGQASTLQNPLAQSTFQNSFSHLQGSTFPQAKFPSFSAQDSTKRGPTNVVITTSDTLPTGVPPVQPTLSVTIPPQHRLGDTSHQFQISVPASTPQIPKSQHIQPSAVESDDENTDAETSQEYDPIPDFKPLVSLNEVPLVTGEESEDILFSSRAKLYRFMDGAWKERGVGLIKILKDKNENKARILMRRDTVHKICANHALSPDMTLSTCPTPNSWIWFAQDFADEQLQVEKLCVKFKTKEESDKFKEVFDKAKNTSPSPSNSQNQSLNSSVSSVGNKSFNTPKATQDKTSTPSDKKNSSFSIDNKPFSTSFAEKPTFGGFTFTTQPKFKTPEEPVSAVKTQIEDKKEKSIFQNFSFSSSLTQKSDDSSNTTPKSTPQTTSKPVTLKSSTLESIAPKFTGLAETDTPTTFNKTLFGGAKTEQNIFGAKTSPQSSIFGSKTSPGSGLFSSKTESTFLTPKSDGLFGNMSKTLFGGTQNQTKTDSVKTNIFGGTEPSKLFSSPTQSTPKSDVVFTAPKDSTDFASLAKNTPSFLDNKNNPSDFSSLAKSSQGFAFGKNPGFAGFKTAPQPKSILFREEPQNTSTTSQASDDGESEFVPTADFKPVIDLPAEVKVVSGEEDETILFEDRAKLFRFDVDTHSWKEKGIGQMKILKNDKTSVVRLVMRRDQVFKVCCNHRLTQDMNLTTKFSPNTYTWTAKDFSDDINVGVNEAFCIKFKTVDQALKFKEAFDKYKNESTSVSSDNKPDVKTDQTPLSALIKHKEGSWSCSACYCQNDGTQATCPACGTANPNKPAGSPSNKPAPEGPTFSFGIPANTTISTLPSDVNICKPNLATSDKFSFGIVSGEVQVQDKTPNNFGFTPSTFNFSSGKNDKEAQDLSKPDTGNNNLFGIKSGFNFGQEKPTFGSSTFQFTLNKQAPTTNESGSEDEGENIEAERDIHFQPVISLPDKVDVVTGEEEEEVLFSHRAKLFRWDNEWKERGIGDVKILKHKKTGKIRLVMRRDTVLKLCLNHYITPELRMEPMDVKSWVWFAQDYSEGEMSSEKFAIRFKMEETAQEFYDAIINCQESAALSTSIVSSSSDDVEIVYELKVPDDLKEKAISLQLPPNYYAYLQKPKCPGCVGCEPDDDDEKTTAKSIFSYQPVSFENPQRTFFPREHTFNTSIQSTSIFGNSSPNLFKSSKDQPK